MHHLDLPVISRPNTGASLQLELGGVSLLTGLWQHARARSTAFPPGLADGSRDEP